jgi:hypothetical protein
MSGKIVTTRTPDHGTNVARIAAHKPRELTALPRGNIVRLHELAGQGTIVQKKLAWQA